MHLRSDTRQKSQTDLASSSAPPGEARWAGQGETEAPLAGQDSDSPANTQRLMEEVCERDTLKAAWQRGQANKGSAGVDGMAVGDRPADLKQHWPVLRD